MNLNNMCIYLIHGQNSDTLYNVLDVPFFFEVTGVESCRNYPK